MAVVISAMDDTTGDLIDQVLSINSNPPEREVDMLVTADERISVSLLAMAVHAESGRACSFTGQQAGSLTDVYYGAAHIKVMRSDRMKSALPLGDIVIVAGLQDINVKGDATALGRGGSGTFAVALAVALSADIYEIYTDVNGIFTAGSRIVPFARRIPSIDYGSILEVASRGSKALTLRRMEYAQRFSISLHVHSSLSRRLDTSVAPGDADPHTLPNLD